MKRYSTIPGLAVGLALLLSAFTPASIAQTKSVLVERRDGDIMILANGDVQFVETWEVQFIGGPFTSAFRSIPLGRLTDIADWGVSENGEAYQQSEGGSPNTFTLSSENGEKKITWRFPQTTDATRTFTLSYTVKGAIRLADGGDEIFWKFVESDRAYSINTSHVVVHLPVAFEAGQLEVNAAGRVVDGQTVEYSGGPFEPGAAWEIQVKFPHGAVSGGVAAEPQSPAASSNALPFNTVDAVLAVLVLGGGTFQLYRLWKKYGRHPLTNMPADMITMPPDNLSPALAGALLDQRQDVQLIVATLVDLAQRGKLHIRPTTTANKDDYIFSRIEYEQPADLQPFERAVLASIFGSRSYPKLSDLSGNFYSSIPNLMKNLYSELSESGYVMPGPPKLARKYRDLGLFLFALFLFGGLCTLVFGNFLLTFLTALVLSVGLLILSRFLSSRTEKGAAAATNWRAFKRHLETIKSPVQPGLQLDRYLPYAIALGLQNKWVAKFTRYASDSGRYADTNLHDMASVASAALAGRSASGSHADGGGWGGSDGGGSDGGGSSGFE